jgi:hypothetical protein
MQRSEVLNPVFDSSLVYLATGGKYEEEDVEERWKLRRWDKTNKKIMMIEVKVNVMKDVNKIYTIKRKMMILVKGRRKRR